MEDALEALRPGLSDMKIDSSLFRPASFIEQSRSNLTVELAFGFVLLILLLGAFLFSWRRALISLAAIAVSLGVAVLALSLLHTGLNAMILAGLVLALIVVIDDAVIDVDGIARRIRSEGQDEPNAPVVRLIYETSLEMRSAASYAALIGLVAVAPTLFATGAFGSFFPSVVLSYSVAVGASLLTALVLTPALSLLLLSRTPLEERESPILRWLRPGYDRLLARTTGSLRPALATAAVIALAGALAIPFLQRSLIPSFKDTDVLVNVSSAPGTSLPEMERVTALLSDDVRSLPGVADVGAHVGRAVLSDQVVGTNAGELWVSVDPEADYEGTVRAIEGLVHGYPGLDREVLTYPRERINQVLAKPDEPLVVRVFGVDFGVLRDQAERIKQLLGRVDGVVNPHVETEPQEPTLEIEVDLAKAGRVGIKPGDVRRAAATLLSGIQVGSLFEEQKVFDVVVWGTPETRHDLTSIREPVDRRPGRGPPAPGGCRLGPDRSLADRDRASGGVEERGRVRRRVGPQSRIGDGRGGAPPRRRSPSRWSTTRSWSTTSPGTGPMAARRSASPWELRS